MSDAMIPSEDALEQNQPVTDDKEAADAIDKLDKDGVPADVDSADAIEQAQSDVADEDGDES
jgi:hypothetical protein